MRFAGKVAIVTGAGSGIGAAVAARLASEGASIVMAGRTEAKLLEQAGAIAQEFGIAPAKLVCQPTDVRQREGIAVMIARAVTAFGRIDVLVNNAGVGSLGRIVDVTPEALRNVYATDVESVFHAVQLAYPHLKAARGNIVNVSSISGMAGDNGMSVYNGAKGAVINFTRGLAVDSAADGIRVNVVSPGVTDTPTTSRALAKIGHIWNERVPLARIGTPAEMASAVAFLASDDASYITGHNLVVDGGLTAHTGQPSLLAAFNL